MKTIRLRVLILAVAVLASVATAYLALWGGIGGHQPLSSANTWFALRVGAVFGLVMSIGLNWFPVRRFKSPVWTIFSIMAGMQIVFGFAFLIWTATVASC
jgi:hypothetical protein